MLGDGVSVGPMLLGMKMPAHVLQESVTARGIVNMTALAVAVIALGVYPYPLMDVMHASVDHLIQQAMTSKL
jgi:NADH:ubiquinone oxidoreductase subunit 4 (subunit M)